MHIFVGTLINPFIDCLGWPPNWGVKSQRRLLQLSTKGVKQGGLPLVLFDEKKTYPPHIFERFGTDWGSKCRQKVERRTCRNACWSLPSFLSTFWKYLGYVLKNLQETNTKMLLLMLLELLLLQPLLLLLGGRDGAKLGQRLAAADEASKKNFCEMFGQFFALMFLYIFFRCLSWVAWPCGQSVWARETE